MKVLFSPGNTSALAFILGVLAVLAIAIAAPGVVQAVLGPPFSSGESSPARATIVSDVRAPQVNPGGLADTGIYGTVGIGTASPLSPLHISSTTSTQPETIDLSGVGPMTAQWNNYYNGSSAGSGFLARFARGTKGAEANVLIGDRLGFIVFGGWAGGAFRHTAGITGAVDNGTVSATSLPTYLAFTTTPNGSVSRSERMRIDAQGRVGINTANPLPLAKLTILNDNATDYASAATGVTASGNTAGVIGSHSDARTWGALGGQWGSGVGAFGKNNSTVSWGYLGGIASDASGQGAYAQNDNVTSSSYAVLACADTLTGNGIGAFGKNLTSNNYGGLGGPGSGAWGVTAQRNSAGVTGVSSSDNNTAGVSGRISNASSLNSAGVYGESNSFSSPGVSGKNTAGGNAGYFNGNVYVTGDITATGQVNKSGGTFRIDHPLDPANKYLQHSFVESPDMKNVYDGNAVLDGQGGAVVTLPAYFETLNRDFRYQLTALGEPMPNLYIAQKVSGNSFKIAGGKAGMEVSWQVTGIRQDPYAVANPVIVEPEKPAADKGTYMHPELYGQAAMQDMDQVGAIQPAIAEPMAAQSAVVRGAGWFNMK